MSGDRELGARLRAVREEAGLTVSQVATYVPCSRSQLSNVEGGRRKPFPNVLLAYETAAREKDMRRREVITGIASSIVAPHVAGDIIKKGFGALLGSRPTVEEWEASLEDYGVDYMRLGAPVVQSKLAGDLVVMQQSLESEQMWSVTARMLALYGKTTKGPKEAIEWYRLAEVAAQRSEELDTQVWVAGRAALALGYEGAAIPTALRFAEQALQLSEAVSGGRLNALMGKSHALATSGRYDEARETWQETQRLYDALDPGDDVTDFNYPSWRFSVIGSLFYSRMGDDRAEKWQDQTDQLRPPGMDRFVTHVELHRALMMAKAGDYAGGVAYGQQALEALPEDKRSQSLTLMLDEVKQNQA